MVRLSDLNQQEAEHLIQRLESVDTVEAGPWLTSKPLSECTVAVVSTAGLHRRDDRPFAFGALDYRLIAGDEDPASLVMSHVSTNFDRSALQQDLNVCFPMDRLRELADSGKIAGLAQWHYSFMGAIANPVTLEAMGEEVGRLLAADGVGVALLIPV